MTQEPAPKKQSAIEFVKAKLALSPEATFAEIKAQARVEGIPIYPVVYGRAKALLGLVPTAPYGSKSKVRQRAADEKAEQKREAARAAAISKAKSVELPERTATEPDRKVGGNGHGSVSTRTARAEAAAAGDPRASLEGMIDDLKKTVHERDRYREVLEKIAELIRAELEPRQ